MCAGAAAQPIQNGRRPLSCPDPSVLRTHAGHYRYYLVCTSDFAPNAFPIRGSDNLHTWHPVGYVFPARRQPWWALHSPSGRYWAPALYRIRNHWVVYFAAQFNPAAVRLRLPGGRRVEPGTFVLGVASARSLDGPWRTRILHYRGEFNAIARQPELYGGDIDPSSVQDPRTGERYLFWAEQPSSIWAGKLSSNGLSLAPEIRQVLKARANWECRTPRGHCVIEGPEEVYRGGWFYLFYSGASTWTGTYAVGVAASQNPLLSPFQPLRTTPDLHSGHGWIGPGGTSAPIVGPGGRTYILYHAETGPNRGHVSADRYLFLSRITWQRSTPLYPRIGAGYPS